MIRLEALSRYRGAARPLDIVKSLLQVCIAVLAVFAPWLGLPKLNFALMTTICIFAVAACGVNLMFGYTGMFSLGGAVFVGVGAYTYALATQVGNWPVWVAVLAAIVVTAIAAVMLGAFLVRLSGYYFGVATLGIALAFYSLLFAIPSAGGGSGLTAIPTLKIGSLTIETPAQWYETSAVITILAVLLISWIVAGKRGRILRMVRQDELAAEVLGVPVFRTKLLVFVIGSVIAGVAGILLFLSSGLVNPDSVSVLVSVQLAVLVIIGGPGYRVGPLIGAFLVFWVQALLNGSGKYELVTYGAVLLVVVFCLRFGIEGALSAGWRRLAGTRQPPTPVIAPDADPSPEFRDVRTSPGKGLEVRGATRRFGGVVAVRDVSITVPGRQVTALIGANGAGKSTLLNLISGVEPLDGGSIHLDGELIDKLTPAQRSRRGLTRTFQVPRLIDELSAVENIVVAQDAADRPLLRRDRRTERVRHAHARAALERLGLGDLADRRAGSLGTGERKYVEVARSLSSGGAVILLDEPAVGLSTEEVAQLREQLSALRHSGLAVLVIDHNIDFIRDLADDVYEMEAGSVVWHGKPADLQESGAAQTSAAHEPADPHPGAARQ